MALIIRRFASRRFPLTPDIRPFSTSQDSQQEPPPPNNQPPPAFDYQAPKDDDSYRNYESTRQLIRRYLIIMPLAALCLYEMTMVRRNEFSRNREFKFVNKMAEGWLGGRVSKKVMEEQRRYVYKQDTREVEANNLQRHFIPLSSEEGHLFNVTLVHNDTYLMFFNLDQRFFLSSSLLDLSSLSEPHLALLLSHELSHYLLDHQLLRLAKAYFANSLYPRFFKRTAGIDLLDPARDEFRSKIVQKQRHSCFYPQQRVVTKYYEKNCDIMAMQMWKKAYQVEDPEKIVEEVYGKMERKIEALPYLDKAELYHSTYTYKRLDVNKKLVKANVEISPVKA
ncbi:hypothetical protein FGO68_gene14586 [Halteria grandinella]|uniref:Peptidase M48 domain-containing protein n=1 Tax=Halteria grandinella TaxID=5974 RepID=A0A8J8NXU1_HALGN|nr:hypothetical protein FGO68_gene14586 [Halteria grandinella]